MELEEYDRHDATGLAALVANGAVTADEMLDLALAQVGRLNPALNAVVLIQEDRARAAIRAGLPSGPLRGVPFLIKDLGCEAVDFPSHNGSRLLANTRYPVDSAIYARIRAAGVVTFGRTTSPEGGIGAATEAAVYGAPTRNPWNLAHTPGGSSGGAGAAVAAGIVPAAHGSDGGGSVRIPAACCGLFGFKATRARFPDGPYAGEGWAGMAIDGFLTRSVRDNAMLMDACAGADSGAPYWAPPLQAGYLAAIARPPRRLRVAVCDTTLTGEPIHPDCARAVTAAARLLEGLGHVVTPARPRADTRGMMAAWTRIVACGTALSVARALNGRPPTLEDIEGVARGAIAHARTISGADYLESVGRIHAYGREMAAFFDEGHDILLSATLAEPPARIGRFAHTTEDYVHFRTGPGMIFDYSPFCAAFNASGQPAASVPLGWSEDGLPIGVHLAAAFGRDEDLIALCAELEAAHPWMARRPPLTRTNPVVTSRGIAMSSRSGAASQEIKLPGDELSETAAIETLHVSKHFGHGDHVITALDDVSVAIRQGEFFTLLGPSGCGKTTLLRMIAGFESPTSGEIRLNGAAITHLPPNRRPVNTVFQSYALFPHLTVAQNIGFGLEMQGRPRAEIDARVQEMLALVRLQDLARRKVSQMSGGQQQRVALARALAPQPKVLLLDEPLSALDLKLRKDMQIELKRLQRETGITFVFVTHDQEEALTMSDRVAVMSAGRIQQMGSPREIYTQPVNRFVAGFIGETNFLEAPVSQGQAALPGGARVPVTAAGPRVTLAVRPELLRIVAAGTPGAMPATVQEAVYFGTDSHVHTRLADGTRVIVRVQSGADGAAHPAPGSAVALAIVPGALQVLED